MELGVLGPLQVRRDGAPVTIPGAKPRAILTMLGLHGGSVVSTETLIELLWGDDPPRTAAKALQTHISALRRTLGDGFVLTQGTGWILNVAETDASRYKRVTKMARDAATAGDITQAAVAFEEALALWRGTPELPDTRRGISEKTRWIEGHAALVEDRADALLATGRAAEIVGELEAAVADAPLRERRWGQLMLALYRAGRQGEALGAYQRARSLLADELGVDPGPELRRLEAAIVAQDAALDMPVAQNISSVTRAVTFLLTDIEGSTAAWEADADAMAVALARHDELVEQVVTSRGGRLIKTRGEGDATFSVFERPSTAAAAAIELQDAISHEPWELSEPMRVRVALHTGEAELRDGDYFGRAVNRAARLRSLATGGQILCSGATAELVIDSLPDDVLLADLGMRQLKNLARPEHVFELRLETAERPQEPSDTPLERPDFPAVLTGPGPFVGRGRELERLVSTWQTVLDGGILAVLVAGEPGVGKTRLAGEWSRQAYEQGAVVLYGRCDEDLGAPYQPFAEALRSLVPCLGATRLRGLRGVEALLALVPGLTDVLPDLAAPTRADPDTERYALFDAVVALLEVASASAPVVLILDDLHWAAKPTLLLLRHLLRFGEHARVQVVGTYRSTDLDRSHPLAATLADLHRDGTANRIQLSGLDEDDVTTYVAEAGYDDEDLARALASVTGGNPFFLIEALRHVDESGGVWDPSTLPQGVREAVSRRLSRLPAETNKALAAAAVVGSRFALDLVERVVDQDLVDAFEEACKAGIVIEEPGGRYRFNHALVRQSLLAELPSVRRMRLHQRIAATLETQPGADDTLLAELAYHYFECAWAGNAAKAVEYCRRAADQAMTRLAYEGAADLYDHALHALEEIDDELPDRNDQAAELLIARCEALLAAGDVASAAGAVSQLRAATVDSAQLAAWATCFDGQLTMLTHPERLDEVEVALAAAAEKLGELADAAGEAKAHTVRAGCLARLGRIGDCEIALDNALTAARRAQEHRRVNAVLAGAPLAALWGPNPVPRAGGRCLDVVRLLRITTDSPAVEATSTRCQAALEAFRGRAAAARRMIDSARRTVTELGLRHALLEVEQFAGIVELVVDDPAAAEPHLRKAYNGFRRMGLDADTAETAALLGRACLALDRDAEADELCSESERLAGHALKASIAWRTLRARLLSLANQHDEARRVAEAAVQLAARTDALVDHGDACATLATVLGAAGDVAGAQAAAERAVDLYERKGAAALAERARLLLGAEPPPAQAPPEAPSVELDTAAARTSERVMAAINRGDWDEFERLFAPEGSVESRRKVVGFKQTEFSAVDVMHQTRRDLETGVMRASHVVVAVRGERLALARVGLSTADVSPGAPLDEFLQLYGLDDQGRIALQVWFDLEDMDAALAELDALRARFEEVQPQSPPQAKLDNACVRAGERVIAAIDCQAWDEIGQLYSPNALIESRRKIVGFRQIDLSSDDWGQANRPILEKGDLRLSQVVIAVRGERLALARVRADSADASPGAPYDEFLSLYGIDEQGRIALQVWFDLEDIDAAMAELEALHARLEGEHPRVQHLENAASRLYERFKVCYAARDWRAIAEMVADDFRSDDRRRVVNSGLREGRDAMIAELSGMAQVGIELTSDVIAIRGERLVLSRIRASHDAFDTLVLTVFELDADGRCLARIVFDLDDFDAAIAELDRRYLAGEAAPFAETWSVIAEGYAAFNRHEPPATTPDCVSIDHRRGTAFAPGELFSYMGAAWDDTPDITSYIDTVHRLSDMGAVVTHVARGSSPEGVDAEWRYDHLLMVDGESIERSELFDEADLDAALARFEELSRPARRLENAATRVTDRYLARLPARDFEVMAEILAEDFLYDDRRRTVNAGVRRGRDAEIANVRAIAELGTFDITSTAIATRGERLILSRVRASVLDERPGAFHSDELDIVELDADERIAAHVTFDPDDFEAAIAELDARYLAGEAAAHAHTWSVIADAYAGFNRRKLLATTPDWVNIDHRRGAAFAPGDMIAYLEAAWTDSPDTKIYIEAVHRLSNIGAVVTHVAHGISQEGFDAEWRDINLLTVDGDSLSCSELFDEADIDAAVARFDELSRPARQLERSVSRVAERFSACFAARDWAAMADLFAEDLSVDGRRRTVNAGIRHGRDATIEDMRASAEVGFTEMTSVVIATRGGHLALARFYVRGQRAEEVAAEALHVFEIDADERTSVVVIFDVDNFDAAIAELDARYLAGEAAPHAHTWSVIANGYAALNRHELPATTPDLVTIDHRRGTAFAPGELFAFIRAGWDDASDSRMYIETVHRLNSLGAVVTEAAYGTSQQGFEAEWRMIVTLTVEGDAVNRCELFDEADLDAAIARFDELQPHSHRLENPASQLAERFFEYFAARDWDAIATTLAENVSHDDRRHVVNAGVLHGRDAQIANLRAIAEVGVANFSSTAIAIRGACLALVRTRSSGQEQGLAAILTEEIGLVEINRDNRMTAYIAFDANDIDAAFKELDARYLAGEAAAHAHTWSPLTAVDAALNRYEIPPHTQDWVTVDHRRATAFAPGDLTAYMRAGWDLARDIKNHILAVHRITDSGAVVTHLAHGTLRNGSDVEWREVALVTFEGDLINRCELFDEADIDAALAKFDELHPQPPRLENAASRAHDRFLAYVDARDRAAIAEILADDACTDDRRRVVNTGVRHGRDAVLAELSTLAEVGGKNLTSETIAIRGERLVLRRSEYSVGHERETYRLGGVEILELNTDELLVARVAFDANDNDAAFQELDTRYMAGEAAPHAQTWSVIAQAYAALNRQETPPTTPDWVNIDHRRVRAFVSGELPAYMHATWNLVPDIRIRIEAVHQLNDLGAVFTQVATGTSQQGFAAEWRTVIVSTVEGDMIDRLEIFDEADLDAALARFEELHRQAPRLENAASQVDARLHTYFAARDWDAMAEAMAQDILYDDRRRVANAGLRRGRDAEMVNIRALVDLGANVTSTVIATRGERLVLTKSRFTGADQRPEAFHNVMLSVLEIDADERVVARIIFDVDDMDAAIAELDARYLAGEAAAHAHTWSVISRSYAEMSRHELPRTTYDYANIDHRRFPMEAGAFNASLRAQWELLPDFSLRIESVHRLSDLGVVFTQAAKGTSREGFDAEWRSVLVMTVEGELLNRCEIFDEADLDAALVRFEELHPQAPRLTNTASQVVERVFRHFAARDWAAMAELVADDICSDDRRSVVNAGIRHGRDAEIADMRAIAGVGVTQVIPTVIATRGEHLTLCHVLLPVEDHGPGTFRNEALCLAEINVDNRVAARLLFDLDDFDAAIKELDARYSADEAATYSRTWSIITRSYYETNRRELPGMTPDSVFVDHRPTVTTESEDLAGYLHSFWDLMPDMSAYIESVHRLSNLGTVVTQAARGTSRKGFEAEWRAIVTSIFEGDLYSRVEAFDEADLDAALARFDELQTQARHLENAASRANGRLFAYGAARNWAAIAGILADDSFVDDRRRVVNVGFWNGRDDMMANVRALAEGLANVTLTVLATRGERLALTRICSWNGGPRDRQFGVEMVAIVEIDTDDRIAGYVFFDPDDIDAAFEELDARYLAGEAAAYSHTWSVITRSFSEANRHELHGMTADAVYVDHRPGVTTEAEDLAGYLRAIWELTPETRSYIEAVHRLSELGSVITHAARGTSQEGFDAEWRTINVGTVDGDLINRVEVFDETDLDAALARFDELHSQLRLLENAASRADDRLFAYFRAGDWGSIAEILTDDSYVDDRRRVVNAGFWDGRDVVVANLRALAEGGSITSKVIATRGERLSLSHICSAHGETRHGEFDVEMLDIAEIDTEGRLAAHILFDLDDIDAAIDELEARYLAGEAAAQAHAWSVIVQAFVSLNRRHELAPTTADWVNFDHRRGIGFAPGQMTAYILAGWEREWQSVTTHIEAIYRLTELGAVFVQVVKSTSQEGFDAEWRVVELMTVEGDLISRAEFFDETDLDAALACFDELDRPPLPQ
ncbi:BTAD domain-containing putative transcriptional regulator [Mycobacterium branderi]|uniref:Uncharacterized protein n=1 Tax=Mycobacterium branderi TaxID=43348 RepID=A0ABM7KUF0_9MYCO|nr:BTAD domain-containing putative transcriptional regulator [Mycobacterium branderi]MCV7232723.1 AAA family ATPase [Mycobacterium branderi]BBZ14762.1 hypothetical protein MBRA_49570 [Mycobacterium branderi]